MPGIVQFSRYRVRPKRAPPALVPSCAPRDTDPATPPGPAAAPQLCERGKTAANGKPRPRPHPPPDYVRRVRLVGRSALP